MCSAFAPSFVRDSEGDAIGAVFYWARTRSRPDLPPLALLGFDVGQLVPLFWHNALWQLGEYERERRAIDGSAGVIVEDVALARAMQKQGLTASPVPEHLTKPEMWEYLCTSAVSSLRSGEVVWTIAAHDKAQTEACPARTFRGGPRPEGDPTVPAYLYGIVCGLDEHAAIPPQPARVKIVQPQRARQ